MEPGKAELLLEGGELVVWSLGALTRQALSAVTRLRKRGVEVSLVDARFAKPLDEERILSLARKVRAVVTVEEHAGMGGFGSAVLELLAREGVAPRARVLAYPDALMEHGDPAGQQAAAGVDAAGIAAAVRALANA